MARLDVLKTYKLYIDGKFPRSESGRSLVVKDASGRVLAHACKASRKDFREAVEAARRAQAGWSGATAYLRGQVLYRLAEMLEARRGEFADLLRLCAPRPAKAKRGAGALAVEREVAGAIDRLVHYAGWADKFAQVLGCQNPVASSHYNFTVPEATGVVAVVAPTSPALLGLISLAAPALVSGNSVVALASEENPLVAAVFGEACATSDLPAGVVNILTGERKELLPFIAAHRDVDAIHAAGLSAAERELLRGGVAENLKRVALRAPADWLGAECQGPWWIEPFVEMKTIWHPASV